MNNNAPHKPSRRPDPMVRIGDLAKLFGMTSPMLHYYERIGLFSPDKRNLHNDFRYYRYDQTFRLAYIAFLRQQGDTPSRIDTYLGHVPIDNRLKRLRGEVKRLNDEAARLRILGDTLADKCAFVETVLQTIDPNHVSVQSIPDVAYVAMDSVLNLYPIDMCYLFPTIILRDDDEERFGAIVTNPKRLQALMDVVPLPFGPPVVKTLPKTSALVGYHKGSKETLPARIDALRAQGQRDQLALANTERLRVLIDDFWEPDPERFLFAIEIPLAADDD